MNPIRNAWTTVMEYRRPYITLNAMYYGVVLIAMVVSAFYPEYQQKMLEAVGVAFNEGPLAEVGKAYSGGKVMPAIALTFIVNLWLGSFGAITLPSLIIPFSGLLVGIYRAVLWGILFSPRNEIGLIMIPHSLTLLLEGQAYILVMLAVYIHGRAFLQPQLVGAVNRKAGYLAGLRLTGRIYVMAALVLAVSAVYEALEVIYAVPLLLK